MIHPRVRDIPFAKLRWPVKYLGSTKNLVIAKSQHNFILQKNKKKNFACRLGNERKGRYVDLLCHDSLIFNGLTNQELRQR